MEEQFEFFWDGPFSQWYPSQFSFEKMGFNCAEQFMMFSKSVFFRDYSNANAVMKSNRPREQKALGRQTQNFNVDKWSGVAKDIVYVGSYCKYTQDDRLKEILMATKGITLVEASPYDKIWGIGLAKSDTKAQQRSTWQGKNWLGEVLTQVREDLIASKRNEIAFKLCQHLVDVHRSNK